MWPELVESAMSKHYKDRTLSEMLVLQRAERPDEWTMDEFIKYALTLERELNAFRSNS